MNDLIAFFGQKQNGKTSCANFVSELAQNNCFWVHQFGDSLKKYFCDLFDIPEEHLEQWKVDESFIPPGCNASVREGLKALAEAARLFKEDVWIQKTFKDFDQFKSKALRKSHGMAIGDGRFFLEIEEIKNRNGISVCVIHPNRRNDDNHRSEKELKPIYDQLLKDYPHGGAVSNGYFDWLIINDGDLNDLKSKVKEVVDFYEL